MNKTNIQYLTHTWNPLAMRCTPIAAGCKNCWHLALCNRLSANPKISRVRRNAYAGLVGPQLLQSELDAPLKRKKPARIGVQLMGDLWHDGIGWENIDPILQICGRCPQHHFLLLTKRITAAWYYFNSPICEHPDYSRSELLKSNKNIQLGVSISTQEDADRLIPILLQIPAAIIWVSFEPLLENIIVKNEWVKKIGWFVIGSESGPKRRLCKIKWIESLVKQGNDAGIPVFVKQAEVDGKVVSMPGIIGRVWDQYPK